MDYYVSLLTPALALFAALVAIGLGIQAFRQGRQIRRLERLVNDVGVAGTSAPLERLNQLQQRIATSSGTSGPRALPSDRNPLVLGGVAFAVVALLAAGWWFFLRDGGDGTAPGTTTATTAGSTTPARPGSTTGAATNASAPAGDACGNVQAPADPAAITVTVFNASGVTGAVANKVWPNLQAQGGYSEGTISNPPDGQTDLAKTIVMYVKNADRPAACAVAKNLRLNRAVKLDGYDTTQIGGENVNVVVLVGTDVANR